MKSLLLFTLSLCQAEWIRCLTAGVTDVDATVTGCRNEGLEAHADKCLLYTKVPRDEEFCSAKAAAVCGSSNPKDFSCSDV
ncbi:hypothetical protein DSO57_1029839 [Entomophthora muscae]|uniref:Uncharacterized protein n=1 Tax=Entomophthora muscae TaxID=34485 RepID=A0ACC2ULX4_9FUNG|nr:hypothetical protein DSO57_1029839 [Entomophthora muscae]